MKRSVKAFTLVEVIVVLVILAILAAILVPVLFGFIDESKAKVCQSHRAQLQRGYYAQYIIDSQGGSVPLTSPEATLATAAKNEFDGAAGGTKLTGICPKGGTYSVIFGENGVIAVKCSVHSEGYAFTPDKYGAYLSQLFLAGSDFFSDYFAKEGITGFGDIITNGYISTGSNYKGRVFMNDFKEFLGDSAKDIPQGSSDTTKYQDFRYGTTITKGDDGKYYATINSVSFKRGSYGYIQFANGNVYQVHNDYFAGSNFKSYANSEEALKSLMASDPKKILVYEGE